MRIELSNQNQLAWKRVEGHDLSKCQFSDEELGNTFALGIQHE